MYLAKYVSEWVSGGKVQNTWASNCTCVLSPLFLDPADLVESERSGIARGWPTQQYLIIPRNQFGNSCNDLWELIPWASSSYSLLTLLAYTLSLSLILRGWTRWQDKLYLFVTTATTTTTTTWDWTGDIYRCLAWHGWMGRWWRRRCPIQPCIDQNSDVKLYNFICLHGFVSVWHLIFSRFHLMTCNNRDILYCAPIVSTRVPFLKFSTFLCYRVE